MIRRATPEDVPAILPELRAFAKFYGTRKSLFPEDEATAHRIVKSLVKEHLFYVGLVKGEIMGFIAGFVTEHVFNPEIVVLTESLWWVKPEARGTSLGGKLLGEFLAWGRKHADWITMTLEHNSVVQPDALLHRGFRHQETSFIYEVQ